MDYSQENQEGYEAYFEGVEYFQCPYEDNEYRYDWQTGWMSARDHHIHYPDSADFDEVMEPVEL